MTIELALALWGAIISTVLGVMKVLENQSNIKIRLTHIHYYENQQMFVTNIGKKPITVQEVGIRIIRTKEELKNPDPYFARPIFPDNEEGNDNLLPKRLEEGESIRFTFSVDMEDIHEKGRIQSYVKDTSGKEYTTKDVFLYDGKYHYEEGKVTKWSSHKQIEKKGISLIIYNFLLLLDSINKKWESRKNQKKIRNIIDVQNRHSLEINLLPHDNQEDSAVNKRETDFFFTCQELINNKVISNQALELQIEILDFSLNTIIKNQEQLAFNWTRNGENRGLYLLREGNIDRIIGVVINEFKLLGISDDIYNQVIYEAIDTHFSHTIVFIPNYSLSTQRIQSKKIKYIQIPIESVNLGSG